MSDRRRYPRVQVDVLCRPAGSDLFHHHRNTRDISLGGMRVFSVDTYPVGATLDIDVLLPDGKSVRCWAQVMWVLELDGATPARYDVGLQFTDMALADLQRPAAVVARTEP